MLVYVPVIMAVVLMGLILFGFFSGRNRTSITSKMMQSNLETLKDMTSGDMGETLKDLSKTVIDVKKSVLEENKDQLKEIADMEAEIEKGAIKTKASAVKEGFSGGAAMFCKHCGASIDVDSKFCKVCGKAQ